MIDAAIPTTVRDADGVFRQPGRLRLWQRVTVLRVCEQCGLEWRGPRKNNWCCPECGWTLRWPYPGR